MQLSNTIPFNNYGTRLCTSGVNNRRQEYLNGQLIITCNYSGVLK